MYGYPFVSIQQLGPIKIRVPMGKIFVNFVVEPQNFSVMSSVPPAIVSHSLQEGDLLRATLTLSHCSNVAITTGFPRLLPDSEIKEGTDGLPGALAVAEALLRLGKNVSLIVDCSNATLFNLVADYMSSTGGLSSKIPVLLLETVREKMAGRGEGGGGGGGGGGEGGGGGGEGASQPLFDCLVAVGRVGRNENGSYLTSNGDDVSDYVDPIDSLFEKAEGDPWVSTVAVGGSPSEMGVGRVGEAGRRPGGSGTGCVVGSDCLVATRVANWAGHALAAGLYAVSHCPLHWRYRNQGIDAETPPTLDINDFVNSERVSCDTDMPITLHVRMYYDLDTIK